MKTITNNWQNSMSNQKRTAILQLIFTNTQNDYERDQWLDYLESTSSDQDANELIKELSSNDK